jgi:hypothetical protein
MYINKCEVYLLSTIKNIYSGISSSLSGVVYEGIWENDLPHGFGTRTYGDKSVYVGTLSGGKKQGNGHIRYSDGSEYAGKYIRFCCYMYVYIYIYIYIYI